MKRPFSILIITAILFSCGSSDQNKAVSDAKEVQSAIKEMRPGTIPTSDNGWTLKAKINGKDWIATSIMSPAAAGRIVGYYNDEYIGLPYYDRINFLRSDKRKLGEGHDGVDIKLDDYDGLWSADKGDMQLTKVDSNWAEGKFSFTAKGSGSDKTIQVTDGFFRISVSGK